MVKCKNSIHLTLRTKQEIGGGKEVFRSGTIQYWGRTLPPIPARQRLMMAELKLQKDIRYSSQHAFFANHQPRNSLPCPALPLCGP